MESKMELEFWMGIFPMNLYQGFWCPLLEPTMSFQTHFQAHDTDVILASLPKTGTTWLKSLLFAIVNRNRFTNICQHPLRNQNAHELVLQLEAKVYNNIQGSQPDFIDLPLPRLFATHIPYLSLPKSMKISKSKVIYVCRNPLDTFVSSWHFYRQLKVNMGLKHFFSQLTITMGFKHFYRQLKVITGFFHFYRQFKVNMIDEDFVKFCEGKFPYGPYEDHVLGYWKESIQNSEKVLFMEYEGLKEDPVAHVKKLAEFVGYQFSEQEEKEGIIDDIIKLCSLESLKEMEVNKSGNFYGFFENKAFFRKGEVGDWSNYLNPSMVKSFDEIVQDRFKDSGFSFKHYKPFSDAPK
ncbi:cytosolic sulfotransferase 13 [Spinacia oleracea]|uniref:Sulfotransferase n=1 Tax=Spinacia oleracea TaxID=3562 RepID=A0A9R0J539_SPIOL|nr:cytosolic sulfotransferase 13-like [Spinacia oleracea]